MEKTGADHPELLVSGSETSGRRPPLSGWAVAGIWGGRVLIVLTVAAVLASWLAHHWWAAQGWDPKGYPRSWLPNVTLILVFAAAISGPWICGLATSPQTSWRDGDDLVAETVAGRRRIRVPGALVIHFRVLGRSGTTYGAFALDRRFRPLMLLGPVSTGGRFRINRLLGRRSRSGFLRVGGEYLLGLLLMVLTCAAVLLPVGVAAWLLGTVPPA